MKSPITSRKHPSVLRPAASAALAMMLPFAAQAADGATVAADEGRVEEGLRHEVLVDVDDEVGALLHCFIPP